MIAYERVTLYGLPLVTRRPVNYGRIDPVAARDMFLQSALVEGDWDTYHAFFDDNRRLLEDVEELEHRARRRDIVVDDADPLRLLRRPGPVRRGLRPALRRLVEEGPARRARPADLLDGDARQRAGLGRRPRRLPGRVGAGRPAARAHLPVRAGRRTPTASPCTCRCRCSTGCRPEGFDWQVPGLRQDLVTAVIKALPKQLRVRLVPAPDTARAALAGAGAAAGPVPRRLCRTSCCASAAWTCGPRTSTCAKVPGPPADDLPGLLRHDRTLGEGKDLAALKARLAPTVQQALSRAPRRLERTGPARLGRRHPAARRRAGRRARLPGARRHRERGRAAGARHPRRARRRPPGRACVGCCCCRCRRRPAGWSGRWATPEARAAPQPLPVGRGAAGRLPRSPPSTP